MRYIFFNGWQPILHTLIAGFLAYGVLIFFLRISGKRTLSKMNAFDLVITVSLGSTLATILLTKNVSLAQGATALALLVGLQFIITWSSVRLDWFNKLVTGEPTLLLYDGKCLPDALRRSRVTLDELQAAARSTGKGTLDTVAAIVLGDRRLVQRHPPRRFPDADTVGRDQSTIASRHLKGSVKSPGRLIISLTDARRNDGVKLSRPSRRAV